MEWRGKIAVVIFRLMMMSTLWITSVFVAVLILKFDGLSKFVALPIIVAPFSILVYFGLRSCIFIHFFGNVECNLPVSWHLIYCNAIFRFFFSNYSCAVLISCSISLYFFKYFPFMRIILWSSFNSSISYALFEKTLNICHGPFQLGDHFPKIRFFLSIGKMTFHTKSPWTNSFDFTFLL